VKITADEKEAGVFHVDVDGQSNAIISPEDLTPASLEVDGFARDFAEVAEFSRAAGGQPMSLENQIDALVKKLCESKFNIAAITPPVDEDVVLMQSSAVPEHREEAADRASVPAWVPSMAPA
jgi:hypothetical protein